MTEPTRGAGGSGPFRPHEVYDRYIDGLPFWQAVSEIYPVDVAFAGSDAKDAWVIQKWAAEKMAALASGCEQASS